MKYRNFTLAWLCTLPLYVFAQSENYCANQFDMCHQEIQFYTSECTYEATQEYQSCLELVTIRSPTITGQSQAALECERDLSQRTQACDGEEMAGYMQCITAFDD